MIIPYALFTFAVSALIFILIAINGQKRHPEDFNNNETFAFNQNITSNIVPQNLMETKNLVKENKQNDDKKDNDKTKRKPKSTTKIETKNNTPNTEKEVIAISEGFKFLTDIPLDSELQSFIYNMCVQNNIEYELILALIWRESQFNPDLTYYNTNGTTDSGLMQINDVHRENLKKKGINNLFDPKQNIKAGIGIITPYLKKYDDKTALMAYQKGVSGMKSYKKRGIDATKAVNEIISKRNTYKNLLDS